MKKIIAMSALTMALSFGAAVAPMTNEVVNSMVSIAHAESANEITAMGSAMAPAGMPAGQARLMARRGAIMDAQRNLVATIKATAVDAENVMENFIVKSDIVKTKVSGTITGARVIEEKFNPDGTYEVVMSVPANGVGSIADIAITQKLQDAGITTPQPLPQPTPEAVKTYVPAPQASVGGGYTGIVIDAKGSGVVTTICPVIYDINGRAIYGVQNIDRNYAIQNGVVEYADGASRWQQVGIGQSRAGSNPLVVKIVGLRERVVNKCDVVISVEDADKILIENQRSGMLNKYAVVFEK